MGNVVSSLLMYALQAAWYCQRLIDQDYRQNHGSRTKPIMGIAETDLDVFLSKCRSYYLSKTKGRTEYEPGTEEKKAVEPLKKYRNYREFFGSDVNSTDITVGRTDGADTKGCLVNNEIIQCKTDQQVVLRRTDLGGLIMDKRDLEIFLTELAKRQGSRHYYERIASRRSDSPKSERRKRKKLYYRKRHNPRRATDRPETMREVSSCANINYVLAIDNVTDVSR